MHAHSIIDNIHAVVNIYVPVQAEHEAPVTAIGLAPDGLTIAVGTENGVIGCLDVPTHQYRTLLRSHSDTINAVSVAMHRCQHTTLAPQLAISAWHSIWLQVYLIISWRTC